MSDVEAGLPILPHTAGEFYVWLWWTSEQNAGVFELGGDVGRVEVWVDERLAFRNPAENKVSAVLTGDNPSTTLEAKAALAGGKVLSDLRVGVRRDDREFKVTLKGPAMDLSGLKLPQMVKDGTEEVLYDRMFLYEELCFIVEGLFARFAEVRTDEAWGQQTLPEIRGWVHGG